MRQIWFILFLISPAFTANGQEHINQNIKNGNEVLNILGKDSSYIIRPVLQKGKKENLTQDLHVNKALYYHINKLSVKISNETQSYFYGRHDRSLTATIQVDKSHGLTLSGKMKALNLIYCTLNPPVYYRGFVDFSYFESDTVGITSCSAPVYIYNSKIGLFRSHPLIEIAHLIITDSKLDSCDFGEMAPDTCELRNVDLSGIKNRIKFNLGTQRLNGHITLIVANVDLKKLNFPLASTNVSIDSQQDYTAKADLYQNLLKIYQDNGYTEKYEEYDKRFQEIKYLYNHHPILNLISKYWWDYGYDKSRVVLISMILFLVFIILNLIFYEKLQEVYWPEKFRDHEISLEQYSGHQCKLRIRKGLKKTLSVILYTGYLFWGLRLEIKDIALKNRYVILLVLVQYIVGVICLAYIANFIISK